MPTHCPGIDQRAAGIPRVNRRVGLDEVLIALDAEPAAPERADDAWGHGLAETERVADGDDEVADLEAVGIAQRHRGQIDGRDLQHGNVGIGVGADQLRRQTPVVFGDDLDAGRVFDDMAVGQDIALRRVDDDARPGCLALVFLRLLVLRQVEKAAEERVLQQRVLLLDPAAHRDVDDPGVTRLSIGARLGTRPPPTAGIGAVASAGRGGSAIAATRAHQQDRWQQPLHRREDLADGRGRRLKTARDEEQFATAII